VAAGCPLLEELNLDSMKITNASLAAIAFLCHRLIALNVCGCNKITSTGVKQVMQHCPRLEVLGVEACEHVPWKLKSEVMRQYQIFWL
jgi:glutamate racemase